MPKSAAQLEAKNLKYYGVKCIYHPTQPCDCAARKAKRRNDV